jgi:competence protein ComEC
VCACAGALALATRRAEAEAVGLGAARERTLEASLGETRESARGLRLRLDDVVAADGLAAPLPRRLLLLADPDAGALRELPPGARLRARVELREPLPLRNPGRASDTEWLARAGIGALAQLSDPQLFVRVPERDRGGPRAALHTLRLRAAARLRELGPGGALLRALALGDRSGLTPSDSDAFARLGLAHLLSVSGLHLALAAGLAYALAAACLRRAAPLAARCDTRLAARAVAVGAALLYALLTGFEVPVQRSLALVVAGLLALSAARTERAWHPLAAAALFVLAREPQALFEAGAQLSFAACAALVAAARHGEGGGRGPRAWLAGLLRTSAAASAATAPIAAWHALPPAPFALPANLLAVPWTGVALMPASLCAALLALLPACAATDAPLHAAAWLGQLSLSAVALAARAVPAGTGAPPSPLWLLGSAALALALVRARSTARLCAGSLALAAGFALAPPARLPPDLPRLVALDVGAGDALLVQGREASLLVDAGSALPGRFDRGRDAVLPALRALGVRRLDLLVASHADLDHRGGLPALLDALPVGALWLPLGGARDPGFAELRAAAARARVPVREIGADHPEQALGDLRVTPLWPAPEARGSRNERSLALRVEVGARRLLLLGDLGAAEARLLAAGAPLRADVLVLPHHGSRGSSSEALLAAVAPEVAIVSAPCRGRLPHPDALARARGAGASLWWTGRDGALLVGLGSRLSVLPYASVRSGCGRPAQPPTATPASARPAAPRARSARAPRTS